MHFETADVISGKAKGKSAHLSALSYEEASALVPVEEYWAELEQVNQEMTQIFMHQLTLR